jgi:hypothetical protein
MIQGGDDERFGVVEDGQLRARVFSQRITLPMTGSFS